MSLARRNARPDLICRPASPMILPMPIRLIHLVDPSTSEDAARLCSLLLRRLPVGEVSQQVVVMGDQPAGLVFPQGSRVSQIAKPLVWPFLWAMPLQRRLRQERPDAILAWSSVAQAAAGLHDPRIIAGVVSAPTDARDSSRWSGVLAEVGFKSAVETFREARAFQLICTNGTIRRRLVESGQPMESTAVIRPGVDFAEIRKVRETMSRERLGLPASGRVFLTPSPASRAGGQYFAAWAVAILHHIWPDARLVVPGVSREQRRIARLRESIGGQEFFVLPGHRYSPAELLAVADALLVPAIADAPTDWIPWAMAAGVPVIGSAVPCVTEYVADRENGFLCRPGEPHSLAVRVRTTFESSDVMAQCVQTARHQAYETFRTERCVEEFLKVIRNLAGGLPALTGVCDAAIDA